MNNKTKIAVGSGLGGMCFFISKAFAETSAAQFPPDQTGNVIAGVWSQAVNNPASFSVIGLLMVIAWLCDDLPFVNSKFVPHITVLSGMAIYWAFANPETVSKIYPHPLAIFLSNGAICGAIAYGAHRQAVARLLNLFREKQQTTTNP